MLNTSDNPRNKPDKKLNKLVDGKNLVIISDNASKMAPIGVANT
jgi:hypothetical protein